MIRAGRRSWWLTALFAGLTVARPGTQQTTFRSGASAIAVDVNVRDGSGRPITNLGAGDFEILDSGVPHQVHDISYGKVPIDITIGLDVSHSVSGGLLNRLRQGIVQLMRDLRPEDRLKLVLFNMRVNRTVDFTNDERMVERAIRGASAGGGTALFDAISVALVSAAAPERRQLVVFFTDGSDSSSITSADTLASVAQRTRATLTFVMPGASGKQVFTSVARETGGTLLSVSADTDLTSTFRNILNEFRSTYVLYYTARGVDRPGYHTIDVRVKRDGAIVQARRGYFGS